MSEPTKQEQAEAQEVFDKCGVDLTKLSELDRRLLMASIAAALAYKRDEIEDGWESGKARLLLHAPPDCGGGRLCRPMLVSGRKLSQRNPALMSWLL
jgi:hypothetical protein